MKVRERRIDGAVVLELHGKLVGGLDESDSFHKKIRSLIDEGQKRVVMDLERTAWASSQGIGMLIHAYTSLRKAGGGMVIVGAGERIRDILRVTRLDLILNNFRDESDAVRYLSEDHDEPLLAHG